jgi:hypothetical protein
MSELAAVRCIGCKLFTITPRTAPTLASLDEKMAALGLGRCKNTKVSNTWHSPECPRQCQQHEPIGDVELGKRRRYIQRLAQ